MGSGWCRQLAVIIYKCSFALVLGGISQDLDVRLEVFFQTECSLGVADLNPFGILESRHKGVHHASMSARLLLFIAIETRHMCRMCKSLELH